MSLLSVDLLIDQGRTYTDQFIWTDTSVGTGLKDLTGCTATLTIRATPTVVFVSPTSLVIGNAAGTIGILLTATQTGALLAGVYDFNLDVTMSDGVTVRAVLHGKAVVTAP